MKGVFLHDQIEYRLEAQAEGLHQGSELPCTLSVKNHSASAKAMDSLGLHLGLGDLKKVKDKAPDAFEITASAGIAAPPELEPQQQLSYSWTFSLDDNCPISEKSQSLFILYGRQGVNGASGQMPIQVHAHPQIAAVLRTMETIFQFIPKAQRSVSGSVECKFKPPAVRRFSFVTELLLYLRREEEALVLRYVFKVKKLEGGAVAMSVKKGKAEVDQRWEPSQYLLSGNFLNNDYIESQISEALATVAFEF